MGTYLNPWLYPCSYASDRIRPSPSSSGTSVSELLLVVGYHRITVNHDAADNLVITNHCCDGHRAILDLT